VADAQVSALGEVDPYYLYTPGGGSLFVKSQASSADTITAIHAAARAIDPALILTVLPLDATIGWSRRISGTVTALFGGLGVVALVLACVGIYGVVAYAVAGRYREIGVRLALGATAWNVLALIVRQTMRPVVVGAAIGVAAAAATSRVLTSVLFGVSPVDAVGLAGAVALVLSAALVVGVLAARPVTAADPTTALRSE
jgi:ABC-type antimicrobial peptide transport system permease subunit